MLSGPITPYGKWRGPIIWFQRINLYLLVDINLFSSKHSTSSQGKIITIMFCYILFTKLHEFYEYYYKYYHIMWLKLELRYTKVQWRL